MNQYVIDRLSNKKSYSKGKVTLENAKKLLEYSIKQYFEDKDTIHQYIALTRDSVYNKENVYAYTFVTAEGRISNNYKLNISKLLNSKNTKTDKFRIMSNPIYDYIETKRASYLGTWHADANTTVIECGKQFNNMYAKFKILGGMVYEEENLFIISSGNNDITIYTADRLELGAIFDYAVTLPDKVIFENGVSANKNELEQIIQDNQQLFETKQTEMIIKAQELLNKVSGKNDICKGALEISTKALYNTVVKNNLLYDGKDSNKSIEDMLNEIFIEVQFKRIVGFSKEYYKKNKRALNKIQISFEPNVMGFDTRVSSTNIFVKIGILTINTRGTYGTKYIKGSSITKLIDKTIKWFSDQNINLEVTIKLRVFDNSWNRSELSTYVENYSNVRNLIETVKFNQQPNIERTLYVENIILH